MNNKLFVFLSILVLGCQNLLFAYPSVTPGDYIIDADVGATVGLTTIHGEVILPPTEVDYYGDWTQLARLGAFDDVIAGGPLLNYGSDPIFGFESEVAIHIDFENTAPGVEILTIDFESNAWLTIGAILYFSIDSVDVDLSSIQWYSSSDLIDIIPGAIGSVIPIGLAPSVSFTGSSISLSCGSVPTGDFIYQYEVFYDESTVIPEPSTYLLLSGMVMVAAFAKSRKKKVAMQYVQRR